MTKKARSYNEFSFDLNAKRVRLSDGELLDALQSATQFLGDSYFTSTQYDALSGVRPHSATIIGRFGSWKKALSLLGITGGRERRYSPQQLIKNLEAIWKSLGYPPGKRIIATMGERISEHPYKRHWGNVRATCEALAAFHNKKISEEQLFKGTPEESTRVTIPLKYRYTVLKGDNFRCRKCGAAPSNDHTVELEIDHIVPVSRGGKNILDNLQTLCKKCNQGKKDR